MIHSHVDDRVLAKICAEDRLDRLCRILETLEAGDEPRFSFYEHERGRVLSNIR